MFITCNRCKTEYDFDDALVSERGTTVRCTNCGDQFKVYRTGLSATPERWVVHRRDGRELVFTDLRDLQRAIGNSQVGRDDTLTRGSAPPRPLGAIAELEPLFSARPAAPITGGTPASASASAPASTHPSMTPAYEQIPARSGRTGRPPPDGPAVPPQAGFRPSSPASVPRTDSIDWYVAANARTVLDSTGLPRDSPPLEGYASGPLAPARGVPSRESPPPSYAEGSYEPPSMPPDDTTQDWFHEPRFSAPSMRSRALRWMVVLFLLGMLGVAGATVGRKYLATAIRQAPPVPQATEGRVDKFLEEGDRALAEGDLETAKESYDKASVLAERDPRVLIDLARLDAARADTDWLKARLLVSDQADVLAAAMRQAQQSADRALRAANRAAEVAPDDPKVARARIDALRLTGNLPGARSLVLRVGNLTAQPETAYVLAALDLAESSPNWPAVLDRLKTAASESNLQRARAALVFALARSGDAQGAKTELEKMAAAAHPHPLLPELRALFGRGAALPASEPDAGKRATSAAPAIAEPRVPALAAEPGDYRSLVQQASQASGAGNYATAEQLYRAALAKSPNDTEALAGLGDVARARGNPSLARSYYERVRVQNPHYLPALTALADLRWEGGDRPGAAKLYRELLDAAPEGPLAARARSHIAEVEAGGSTKPPPKPTGPVERVPAPSPTSEPPPEIDTSDLPGFQR